MDKKTQQGSSHLTDKIKSIIKQADPTKRFTVLQMPEEMEMGPHWLFWWTLILFVALVGTAVYYRLAIGDTIQAYLPVL